MNSQGTKDLHEFLKSEYVAIDSKYPKLAVHTFKDERVIKSLDGRFSDNRILNDIKALSYDFYTGLNFVIFEFAPKPPLGLERDSFLVIIDQHSNVVGLVDPFNPDQPNKFFPPLKQTYGEVPFVIERPSTKRNLETSNQQPNIPENTSQNIDIEPDIVKAAASKKFYDRIMAKQNSILKEEKDDILGDIRGCRGGHGGHSTRCPISTVIDIYNPWDVFFGDDNPYDACDSS